MAQPPLSARSEGPHVKVIVRDGVLTLTANLQRVDYAAFQRGCHELRHSPEREVTLDLSHCTYGSSSFIGDLVEAVTQMKTDGKLVNVQVSPELGRLLHMAHLYHLFAYQIVDTRLESQKP